LPIAHCLLPIERRHSNKVGSRLEYVLSSACLPGSFFPFRVPSSGLSMGNGQWAIGNVFRHIVRLTCRMQWPVGRCERPRKGKPPVTAGQGPQTRHFAFGVPCKAAGPGPEASDAMCHAGGLADE
jgi:hypothetical protein